MTIQERLLLSGCAAGLKIAEVCHRKLEASLSPRYPSRTGSVGVAGGSRPISALASFGQGPSALKGLNRNLSSARAVSPFGIGFLTPCLKETAGIKFDHSKTIKGREPCSGK